MSEIQGIISKKPRISSFESIDVAVETYIGSGVAGSWGLRFTEAGICIYSNGGNRVFVPWFEVSEFYKQVGGKK